jgi:hypothetical protein
LFLAQVFALAALAVLAVTCMAPRASAAPVPQLRKLSQVVPGIEGTASVTWEVGTCK